MRYCNLYNVINGKNIIISFGSTIGGVNEKYDSTGLPGTKPLGSGLG